MPAQTITDIERAACTLLADQPIVHPVLREWARKVTAELDYQVRFYQFVPSPEVAKSAADWGFAPAGEDLDDQIRDGTAFSKTDAVRNHSAARFCDTAAMHLAMDIVRHRQAGRVEGDYTTTLHGIGGPLTNVTSSLAARVVQFHKDIVNQLYSELEDAQMGIK